MRKRRFTVKASRDARRRSVRASETIVYRGKRYNADTVSQYYDMDVTNYGDLGVDTAQEFFDRYIELDPDFVELFKYDINPIESSKSVKCSARRRRSVRASRITASAKMYVDENNGSTDVLITDGNRWWYANIDSSGMFGDVDMYSGDADSVARDIRNAIKRGDLYEAGDYVSDAQSGDDLWYEVPEFRGKTIKDIEYMVNYDEDPYNGDVLPKGHDESYFVEV